MAVITIPLVNEFFWPLTKSNKLSNFVDKCHYSFTTGLIFVFALVTAASQFVGDPINCMVPKEFSGHWANFVHSYCFITQTYVKDNSMVYPDGVEPRHTNINYYQWVPYVLIVQGLLFVLPCWFWILTSKTSNVDYDFIVDQSVKARVSKVSERAKIIAEIPKYLNLTRQNIENRRAATNGLGSFSTRCYMFSKLLSLCNVFAQLALVNYTVGYGHYDWGFKVIRNSMNPMGWNTTGYFPRTAYCEFSHDYTGGVNNREVLCTLMANFYNEKIYLVLYFWFILLSVMTFIDIVEVTWYLATNYLTTCFRQRFLNVYFIWHHHKKISYKFISGILGLDGLFLLYFIKLNAGSIIASEIASELYKAHYGGSETFGSEAYSLVENNLMADNGKQKSRDGVKHLNVVEKNA